VAIAEFPMYGGSGQHTGRTQLLSRALELVPSESHAEGRLLSRYGLELGRVESDYEGAVSPAGPPGVVGPAGQAAPEGVYLMSLVALILAGMALSLAIFVAFLSRRDPLPRR